MRPSRHARSSAREGAGGRRDDLAVHEFLDAADHACAGRRHHAVLHHVDPGTEITRAAFADRADVDAIVRRHVEEDLGRPVMLEDWSMLCDADGLPRLAPGGGGRGRGGDAHRDRAARWGGPRRAGCLRPPVPAVCFPCEAPMRALPLPTNRVGPMIVRRVFGPPVEVADGGVVDHGRIAGAAIPTAFGRIPDLGAATRRWRAEPSGGPSDDGAAEQGAVRPDGRVHRPGPSTGGAGRPRRLPRHRGSDGGHAPRRATFLR